MRRFIKISFLLLLALSPPAICYWKYHALHAPVSTPKSAQDGRKQVEVLFFHASWCGPCRMMEPIVAQLQREGHHLSELDVERNEQLGQQYEIHSIPTFVFLKDGKEVYRHSGTMPVDNLRKLCINPAD